MGHCERLWDHRDQAILLGLDRKNHEREMISVLLATLHPKALSEAKLAEGFTALMLACEVCNIS
jgi:hypothetical protein